MAFSTTYLSSASASASTSSAVAPAQQPINENENSTFTPFPRLPVEIQDQIWTAALPPPRLIKLQTEHGELQFAMETQSSVYFTHIWTPSKHPVPSLLHTTQHSRLVALRHYTPAFDHNPRPPKSAFTKPAEGVKPLRRGRSNNTQTAGSRDVDLFDTFEFPFSEEAMVYVDLKRDVFMTSHRRLHKRRMLPTLDEDSGFENMPVGQSRFKLAIFRALIPRSVFEQIRTLVCTFALGMHELFPGSHASGMSTMQPVFVIRDPFLREGNEETDEDPVLYGANCGRDFINRFKGSWRVVTQQADREKFGERITGPMKQEDFKKAFMRGDFFVDGHQGDISAL